VNQTKERTLHEVTVCWHTGFVEVYETYLNSKQIASETDRYNSLTWVDSVDFKPLKDTNKKT